MATNIKRMKALGVAIAVVTGLAVSSVPAQAANCDGPGGAVYNCAYGITLRPLTPTESEEFLVGADGAVWSRFTTNHRWGGWISLGGAATSEVFVEGDGDESGHRTTIIVLGTDGKPWQRVRQGLGRSWSDWARATRPE
ncbi:hypothetical protein ACFWUW_14555 [Streptomyces sp. NPDC058655]|uniref:hypothetical protein n=1 Tax=Streptomyces sp. NPDC058655 TaxID=3346577 RepID=UPI003666578E